MNGSQQSVVLKFKTIDQPIVTESIVINLPRFQQEPIQQPDPKVPVPGRNITKGNTYDDYVALAAFAARSAYAPDRLTAPPSGIVALKVAINAKRVQAIMREKRIRVTFLSSYVYRGLHVTVLELENMGAQRVYLLPELIRGRFVAKSFHHTVIGVDKQDRYSALYVISQVPFADVLEEL